MALSRPLIEKILPRSQLLEYFSRPRTTKLVFTNGCFDIIHRGHVEYLEYARSLGDALIVGLNSDRSVSALKGPGRPINSEDDRAVVLAALRAVDAVTIFDEDTPYELIRRLLPDVLVKGGDYTADDIVGAPEVRGAGGRVEIAPLVPGRSTSKLIEKTREGES